MKTLKEVQKSAIKQGHCHCNFAVKCPCNEFKKTKKCKCYLAFSKKK